MAEQQTCGEGLAERSVLPETLARLTAALAEVLEVHTKALDSSDRNSKIEHDAYSRLVEQHRRIAAELAATAKRMAGYRNLAMGRHDEQAMASATAFEAFEKFVEIEEELLAVLQSSLAQDRTVLSEMAAVREG